MHAVRGCTLYVPDSPLLTAHLPVMSADASTDVPVATVASNPETVRPRSSDSTFDLPAALLAGLAAGVLFLLMELVASTLGAGTPMGPARATIKDLFGVAPGQFTTAGLLSTLGVHFALSLITAGFIGRLVHRFRTYIAVIFGGAFGGFLYTANVLLVWAGAPTVTIGGELAMIINYVVFGIAAAGAYKFWQHRREAR